MLLIREMKGIVTVSVSMHRLHTGAVQRRALYNLHHPPGPETPCRLALSVSTRARMQ